MTSKTSQSCRSLDNRSLDGVTAGTTVWDLNPSHAGGGTQVFDPQPVGDYEFTSGAKPAQTADLARSA